MKIYLHWSATHYSWVKPGHYHTVILGDGTVKHLTGYDRPLAAHTYRRNKDSVAIAIACMGEGGWPDYPPTPIQIENLCKEVAQLAFQLGWKPEDISIYRVLTHAEAAANRDFPIEKARAAAGVGEAEAIALGLPHDNYGPSSWFDGWPGGTAERWDLWQLKPNDRPGEGGFILREKIKAYLSKMNVPEISIKPATPDRPNECKIYLESQLIAAGILLKNRCYAPLANLTSAYQIKLSVNKEGGFINLLTDRFKARYLADSPLILGYPVIDIYLNRPETARGEEIPILKGILWKQKTWIILADFCQELGIEFEWKNQAIYLRSPSATPSSTLLPALGGNLKRIIKLLIPYKTQLDNWYNPSGSCNVTSIAMCLEFFKSSRKARYSQFKQLEDELYQYALDNGLSRHSGYDLAKIVRAYKCQDTFKENATIEEVQEWLSNGNPAVIHGYFTDFGHIVTVAGYDENGLIVHDPYGEWFEDGYRTDRSGAFLNYSYDLIRRTCMPDGNFWVHFISK